MKICCTAGLVTEKDNYYRIDTDGAEVRVWFLTDHILRIRAGFDGDWDEASYSLVMTAWDSRTDELLKGERRKVETAPAELTDGPKEAVIQGRALKVVVHKEPFFLSIYDGEGTLLHEDIPDLALREDGNRRRLHTSRIEKNDHFYGFGEKTGRIDKAGETMVMAPGDALGYDPARTDGMYKHIPFYIKLQGDSKKAVGYFYHTTAECSFDMGRTLSNYWHRHSTFSADSGDIDLFLIAGPTFRDVIRCYTDLTGKSALLPRAALGYLGSSMYYPELPKDCDDAILSFVDTARKEGIPMDGFHLSSGYCAVDTEEGLKRCSFTWNRRRFKDPAAWFAAMEERGIVVSANVKPGMLLSHPLLGEMKTRNMFLTASPDLPESSRLSLDGLAVGTWWGGKGLFVDFTRPAAREAWKTYLKNNLLDCGCPSVWNDNCEYDSLIDKDSPADFEGWDREPGDRRATIGALRSVMAGLMCKLSNEATLEQSPTRRPYSVCRSGHAGIQRYAQVWAGDNETSWETLRWNVATILGMGLSGVANNGCDIGGFCGPAPEPELFVRWVQNGIFQPRFSIHSTNTDNTVTEPWMYSGMTGYIRDAIRFRYRMSPYLYSLMYRAHEVGLPIMEALVSAFQNDPRTWQEDLTFLWGDSLLAATVVEKGQTRREVYLPDTGNAAARWYDFYTREPFDQGTSLSVPVDLSSVPLFVKSGAIVPMSAADLMSLSREAVRHLHILLAPDVDEEFTLYEDDGISNDYLTGAFRKTRIQMKAGLRTVITFTGEGSYESPVEDILLDVICRDRAPFYVQLDGADLPHFLHRPRFEEARMGWYYSQTLRSVMIKYPAPEGDHRVVIGFEKFDLIGM